MKNLGAPATTDNQLPTFETMIGVPSYAKNQQLTNRFDPVKGVYNWKASNTRQLRRGLGFASKGGRTDHLILGDSTSAGCTSAVGTTTYDRLNAWPLSMRSSLAGMGVPAGGTGLVRINDGSLIDSRYTRTGTWTDVYSWCYSTVVASSITFTPDMSGSIVEFHYYDSSGSTCTISVNGATSGTGFRTLVASGSAGWKVARLTGQSIVANQSKIVVTVTAGGTSGVITRGINVFSPNGGLVVHNTAQSGATAAGSGGYAWNDPVNGVIFSMGNVSANSAVRSVTDAAFTNNSATMTSATAAFTVDDIGSPVDQFTPPVAGRVLPENTVISGFTNSTTVTLSNTALATATAQSVSIGRVPSVIHICLGGNDQIAGTAISTITAAITTLRNTYFPTSDCILHLFEEFSYSYITQANQDAFAAALYKLADTLDVPLFDWRLRIGTFAQGTANGAYGDTQAHMSASAQSMVGSLLAEVIGESAGKTQMPFVPAADNDATNKKYVDDRTRSTTVVSGSVLTTVETVIMQMFIPANSLKVGSALDFKFSMKPGTTTITTTRVRIGTTGTASDAAVATLGATAATQTNARISEGVIGIATIGTAATFIGGGFETNSTLINVGVQGSASGTFDSTKDNYISITVQNTTSATTTVHAGRAELTY